MQLFIVVSPSCHTRRHDGLVLLATGVYIIKKGVSAHKKKTDSACGHQVSFRDKWIGTLPGYVDYVHTAQHNLYNMVHLDRFTFSFTVHV